MALQIKKKFIQDGAVDGLKILLQADQTLRRLMEDGSTQDVISYLENLIANEKSRVDSILAAADADKDSFAEIVALINSVDTENDQAFAAYVLSNDAALAKEVEDREAGDADLQAKIDAEIADRESGDQNIQSQITALQGAEGIVFEDNAAVYADGTAPIAEPSGQDGWYYKNDGQNIGSSGLDKINWYFFDGSVQTETIDSALTGYAVGEIKGTEPFHLAVYTFPQGDGNDAGSWYRTRVVYVPANGSYEQNKKYLFVTNLEDTPANLYPDLERVEMVPSQISTVGPQDPSEQILTASLGTNSAAQPNTVEVLVNNVGYVSSVNGVVDTRFEIRGDFTLAGIKDSLSEEEFKRQSEDERVLSESKSYTDTKVSELVDSAPEVLDTLKELSDALGGDENFATTVANNIGQVSAKVDSEAARIEGLVSDEEAARTASDLVLESSINSEEAARIAGDADLQSKLDTEEAARIAADEVIDGRLASLESFEYETETKVLSASDLNEIVFSKQIVEKSMVLSVGRLMLLKGIDYSLEVQPDNSTKLTFIGSVAQGGEEALAEGETLQAVFQHKV